MKPFGLVLPHTTPRRLTARIAAWLDDVPAMRPAILALLTARSRVADELERLDRLIAQRAAQDPTCRRLATIPGVGAITATCFVSVVDDPERFARADQVAAYLGLTPRRWQSGEVDRRGGVSRAGNAMARHLLYEAANCLLARVKRPCALPGWGRACRSAPGRQAGAHGPGPQARRPVMHKLWRREQDFDWGPAAAAA